MPRLPQRPEVEYGELRDRFAEAVKTQGSIVIPKGPSGMMTSKEKEAEKEWEAAVQEILAENR